MNLTVQHLEDTRDDSIAFHLARHLLYLLVVEIKGFRGEDAVVKAETMLTQWVPGVNALGSHGRWAFCEFRSAHDLEADFEAFVSTAVDVIETS